MAVKLTRRNGQDVDYPDNGRDHPTYRYQLEPGGAVSIVETPDHHRGLSDSKVIIVYGPHAWDSVQGTAFGGTMEDLSG